MTPQEMFDKAYLGVIQQGSKSQNADGGCAYRGQSGNKCGIGHLIPDDLAKAWDKRTNSSILHIRGTEAYPIPDFIKNNMALARAMQHAHDACENYSHTAFIGEFKYRMEQVAKDHKLTIPQLETTE
jgi:hypothetical protein